MSELVVSRLHAGYARLEVLHGLDLTVGAGELVAVIGANGAGKTTLLRTLSGLIRPSAGEVRLGSGQMAGVPAEKLAARGIAHVPENRLVFPTLTVQDNLALGAYARGRSGRADLTADRTRVLELFPRLRDRMHQVAGTLSGGEQQMLAIGRGLMARPTLLLLDEPSLGLAPKIVTEIFVALTRLRDDDNLSILLVEQNARAAFKVANRAYVMDRGRIAMEGSPANLLDDPRVHAAYLGGGYTADPTKTPS